jgi:hypothetical protein
VAVFPITSACPGISRQRTVVEIVDVSPPEFHNVQQVSFSKLLNLKMLMRGGPLSPRRFPAFSQSALFSKCWFHWRCARPIESC